MFQCDQPDKLRQEIKAGEAYRDKFLKEVTRLVERDHARYYRSDRQPDRAITENHAYEFLSIMLPLIAFDNPRCKMRAADPQETDANGFTMGLIAKGVELTLNRWSVDSQICDQLRDLAVDFFFSFGVALVTIADQPGYEGAEMVPQRPYLMRLAQHHFLIDPAALTHDVMQLNGPRWMGHMWKADKDDLLNDPNYNADMVLSVSADADLEKYDPERKQSHDDEVPAREEIIGYDIWVPEKRLTDEPGYNGAWYTIAVNSTADGGIGKRAREIRDPRPAYCGPWGPYVLFGAHKVPNCPFPLSPLVATAEQAEEVNAHTTAAAEDARSYKRFVAVNSSQAGDAEAMRNVRNGEVVLVNDPKDATPIELGGMSKAQADYMDRARERLDRASGLSGAMRGETDPRVTATADSIAQSGTNTRTSGLQKTFRDSVGRVFKAAAWFVYYGEDVIAKLGDEGDKYQISQFRGGVYPGQEHLNFFDLSLTIDPYSLEHTSQGVIQTRMQNAIELLTKSAAVMAETPWIKWREPIKALFDVMNVGEADDWIDFGKLSQGQQPQAPPPQPPKPPSESLNYKDAPEDIKRQIEAQAGLQPSIGSPSPVTHSSVSAPAGSGAMPATGPSEPMATDAAGMQGAGAPPTNAAADVDFGGQSDAAGSEIPDMRLGPGPAHPSQVGASSGSAGSALPAMDDMRQQQAQLVGVTG